MRDGVWAGPEGQGAEPEAAPTALKPEAVVFLFKTWGFMVVGKDIPQES